MDYTKVARDLVCSGYHGEAITVVSRVSPVEPADLLDILGYRV